MILIPCILLSVCSLYALFRLGDDTPSTPQTAYIPIGVRRAWSVAAMVCTLLMWFLDHWFVIAAALLTHLGAMVCRNACIRWDDRKLRITGTLGLQWTYEYAQIRYLPGRFPVIVTSNHIFILWPGMVYRATFIAWARERCRIVRYAQAYRKRAYIDPKSNQANQGRMLYHTAFALVLALLIGYLYWPFSETSGERAERALREATMYSESTIQLNFSGQTRYRIPYNSRTSALLEEDAIGQTYRIHARFRSSGGRYHRTSWYQVIALEDADGTVYRTLQESNAALDRQRPYAILSGVVCWFMFRKSSTTSRAQR